MVFEMTSDVFLAVEMDHCENMTVCQIGVVQAKPCYGWFYTTGSKKCSFSTGMGMIQKRAVFVKLDFVNYHHVFRQTTKSYTK